MAQVSMQQVKELRERTQAGLNDCRSALVEADGNIDAAVEIILKKGLAKSAKRAGAVAAEGEVRAQVASDKKSAAIVEVNIQTDFAARNQEFRDFVGLALSAAMSAAPGTELGSAPSGGSTLDEVRQALVGKLGENIVLRRWERLSIDGPGEVTSYVHMGGKIGVLLAARCGSAAGEQSPAFKKLVEETAMQIAAMAPQYLSQKQVPESVRAKQAEIFDAQLVEEGKPEKVRPGIIQGKLRKWLEEICLLEQKSVLETEKSVAQLVAETAQQAGTTVELVRFVRFERGEGIDKPVKEDFASEVARMSQG
jgi:elongation factor Ts